VIYTQAHAAEALELTEICGVGYRKALEFLIKDYLITKKPEKSDDIRKMLLGGCIDSYVDDPLPCTFVSTSWPINLTLFL
jgi:hypothetical protein